MEREKRQKGKGRRGERGKEEKGRKKKRKRRNSITIPAHWIASFLYSLSTSIVLQVESDAQGTRLTF